MMAPENIPKELLRTALSALKNAYAPYSHFFVGAAVETKDGKIYSGTNLENSSLGLTICAEVGAIQAALTAGKFDQIVRIAIVGGPEDRNSDKIVTPCGRCRQIILESAHLSGVDIDVWCSDLSLTHVNLFKISELLPFAFELSSQNNHTNSHPASLSGKYIQYK